jgi:hypothetical protein
MFLRCSLPWHHGIDNKWSWGRAQKMAKAAICKLMDVPKAGKVKHHQNNTYRTWGCSSTNKWVI